MSERLHSWNRCFPRESNQNGPNNKYGQNVISHWCYGLTGAHNWARGKESTGLEVHQVMDRVLRVGGQTGGGFSGEKGFPVSGKVSSLLKENLSRIPVLSEGLW